MFPEKLVRMVLALYDDSKSCVAAAGGMSDAFNVSVRVHQGSTLSPILWIVNKHILKILILRDEKNLVLLFGPEGVRGPALATQLYALS